MIYDLAIIGGGVNGCGIARDAAGRGASVVLFEQGDLASGTSSSSTKLIHGGLRYLEHFEFRLVREALIEREVIWRMAPHIVWPLRFVLPYRRGMRPAWLLRLGLFLYDHLGGRRELPPTTTLDLAARPEGSALKPDLRRGFAYSDCWVEDSRLVVLNALDAAERGAAIRTRTRVVAAERGETWRIRTEGAHAGTVEARALVNAAGPWANKVLSGIGIAGEPARGAVRLVQGSHIVVPRIGTQQASYIFQNLDGRIVFAIPYEGEFTLIGTTDRDYHGDPAHVEASPEEIAYLCSAASDYLRHPITPQDVVWTYSGVRALYDDGTAEAQKATRDYVLRLDESAGPPLLSVFGGKITTYRRLAEAALHKLSGHLPAAARPAWTGSLPLPGGDFPMDGYEDVVGRLRADHPYLSAGLARRLVRAYGTRAWPLLDGARGEADLGEVYGADLTEREVAYLVDQEWAGSADDILWRRSKLGLRFSREQTERLEARFASAMSVGAET